jgi:hypothetical protein
LGIAEKYKETSRKAFSEFMSRSLKGFGLG